MQRKSKKPPLPVIPTTSHPCHSHSRRLCHCEHRKVRGNPSPQPQAVSLPDQYEQTRNPPSVSFRGWPKWGPHKACFVGKRRSQDTGGIFCLQKMERCILRFDDVAIRSHSRRLCHSEAAPIGIPTTSRLCHCEHRKVRGNPFPRRGDSRIAQKAFPSGEGGKNL